MKLLGKVALVTGGASGLGKATALRLVKNGCSVALFDLPTSQGQEVAAQIDNKRCMFVPGDVTSQDDVKKAIATVMLKWKQVNCAGVLVAAKTYSPRKKTVHSFDLFRRVIDIHINGTFNVSSQCSREMAKNAPGPSGERGVIINTSSVAAFDGTMSSAAYSAAKGGISSMTLPMARDLAVCGIRVVAIAPGLFNTAMINQISKQGQEKTFADVLFPRRFGNPEEFAHLVQTVIENEMLNGEVLRIDAGIRMQSSGKRVGPVKANL
uniref:3-hydroxyacyl-CoA dehydrogenase type-2-like n=1 Tax=Phallusia mammillata TaxID=59560 RepID=A0A6F9DF99_9ASCI|nr:3-hydroxyacyl-CoA dehydrogenase type-2-like [Phallusia mammillata]